MPVTAARPVPNRSALAWEIGLVTPRQVREWAQLVLGAACIIQQLVVVSLGRQPEILVWSGGVALLGATLLSFADTRRDKPDGNGER